MFTGNEEGALFGWWAWRKFQMEEGDKVKPEDVYMIASTVSSKILGAIAKKVLF